MAQMPVKQDRWSKPFLVVDLDPTAIRVLEVSPSTQGPFLKWGATMVDRANGKPYREAATEGLQQLLSTHGMTARETRLLLSGPSTVTLPLDLPPLPAKEVPNAVRWSALRAMPFPMGEAVFDHHSLGAKSGEQEQTVLVAAVRRSALDESVGILQAAGLSPVQVTVLPLALSGLMHALPVKSKETTLLLDLRPHLATLIFFRGHELHMVRSLAAEGGAPAKGNAESKGTLQKLVDEIWLSLAYYQERFSGEKIHRLLVAGSTQDLDRVQSALSEAVGIAVEPVNLSSVLLSMGKEQPMPPALAAAAGILFDPSKVNLLPREIRYSKQRKVLRTALRAAAVTLLLGVLAWTGIETLEVRQKRQEVLEHRAAQERMSSVAEEVRRFQHASATIAPTLSIYEEPLAFNRRWLGALKALSVAAPPALSLTGIESDGTRGLKMKGLVFADADPPELSLSEFMARLSESPYFGTVTLGSSQEQSGYPQRTLVFDLIIAWR
jgi:Tfp pilus assembly PilM family ATPase/Tfp pilus assembly protein PilN